MLVFNKHLPASLFVNDAQNQVMTEAMFWRQLVVPTRDEPAASG
jgi:hypothetical protein